MRRASALIFAVSTVSPGFTWARSFEVFGIDALQALVLHVGQPRLDVLAGSDAGRARRGTRPPAPPAEPACAAISARGLFAERNGFGHALEIGRRDVAHDHVDADVAIRQRFELQVLVGHDHDVRAAAEQLRRGLQLLALDLFLDQVDDDDHVRTEVASDVDRDVADHAAVGEDVLVGHDGREGTRNRHAGAHGGGQVAVRRAPPSCR